MTPEAEKELLATLKRIDESLRVLSRHAQQTFSNLQWPTVSVDSSNPPRAHAIGAPPAGKLQGQ
jgi:hypothetical protein